MDFKQELDKYLKKWHWFALGLLISLLFATLKIRYSTNIYEAVAKVQILDEKGKPGGLSVFDDLDFIDTGNTKVEDEMQIILSRPNVLEVIKRLNLNQKYYTVGNVVDREIYDREDFPFSLNFVAGDSLSFKVNYSFEVEILSEKEIIFRDKENEFERKTEFGNKIQSPIGSLILIPNLDNLKAFVGFKVLVRLTAPNNLANFLLDGIKIAPTDEFSNVLRLSYRDTDYNRARKILDELLFIYQANYVAEKKEIADKTSQFINDRIADIYSNLSEVDESAKDFKTRSGLADLGSQNNVAFQQSAAGQAELQNARIQLNIASNMRSVIDGQNGFEVLPEVGLADASLAGATENYNQLVLERKRLLKSSTERSPLVQRVDEQLRDLRKGIQGTLNNVENNLSLRVNGLSRQLSSIQGKIYAAPGQEQALREIARQQQTTESLYLYLLQKREESQITFASSEPNSKIVESAYSSGLPVAPKKSIIVLAALILGLFIPFGIIYAMDILDNRISNLNHLNSLVKNDIPVLGELPKIKEDQDWFLNVADRSVLGESLRIIRTNLDYILKTKSENNAKGKTIMVSSSVSTEGKTFVSTNLALVYASTGKKVILVGADIRKPKIPSFDSSKEDKVPNSVSSKKNVLGLSEYLHGDVKDLKNIISSKKIGNNSIDIIYSGKIPPNPTELLIKSNLSDFIDELRAIYDYIIFDSAPMMLVTDSLIISEFVDQLIYVVKSGFTEVDVIDFPQKLLKDGKIKSLNFVVNAVKESNLGYGGKYGYGYGEKQLKWHQRLNPKNWSR